MNRLEMAEEIARRVPMLAERDKDDWRRADSLRADFVRDFPVERIPDLSLDRYVVGHGATSRSFCYRLEREMEILGIIQGATAFKFGVYFGRTKTDPADVYRFAPRWGETVDGAFTSVKEAIADLLRAAEEGDEEAVAESRLSPMFKGKILFVYYPEKYAPIYSEKHLKYFISKLDLSGPFRCEADMQQALTRYRETWPELRAQSPALYMEFLYEVFGWPPDNDSVQKREKDEPLLDDAIRGARFIDVMPRGAGDEEQANRGRRKLDYEMRARNQRRIGDRGEALVFQLEKKRLLEAGRIDLANRVEHVSQTDDSVGYDIMSFEVDETERPIEVKATTGPNLDRGFFITSNEMERAAVLPNYHLYIVFSAMSRSPQVLPMRKPSFRPPQFSVKPICYQVTVPQG